MRAVYCSLLTLTISLILPLIASAQFPDIAWNRSFGDKGDDTAFAVIETFDGGFLMVGSTSNDDSTGSGSHRNGYAVKTDSEGNVEWNYSLQGDGESAFYAAREVNGGYILFGDGRRGTSDSVGLLFQPLFSNGTEAQRVTYPLTLPYNLYFGAMTELGVGNYYIAANFSDGIGVLSIEPTGAFSYHTFNGGHASAITTASNGDLVIGGYIADSISGKKNTYMMRVSGLDDTVWTQVHNSGTYDAELLAIRQSTDGFIIGGHKPVLESKITSKGFHMTYGDDGKFGSFYLDVSTPNFDGGVTCVRTPTDTQVVYCMSYHDTIRLIARTVKPDEHLAGFFRIYSGSFYARDIHRTSDGGWIIAGYTINPDSTTDALLLKLGQSTLEVPKQPDSVPPTEMNLSLGKKRQHIYR